MRCFTYISSLVKRSHGFSLIEVLVALAITGMIMGGISTAIFQMFVVNNQNTNAITAQRQVQYVGFNMSRDGQSAQVVTIGNSPVGTGFPVTFEWIDWDGNKHEVEYRISDGTVFRSESINDGSPAETSIASDIAAAGTLFSDTSNLAGAALSNAGDGTFHLTITATVGENNTISESRYYEIKQRAG